MPQGDPYTHVSARIPTELADLLSELASRGKVTRTVVIQHALGHYLGCNIQELLNERDVQWVEHLKKQGYTVLDDGSIMRVVSREELLNVDAAD